MDFLIPALICLLVLLGVFGLMLWGWKARVARQDAAFPAPERPRTGMELLTDPVAGSYVATTLAGAPLERVAAHHLGVRTDARLCIGTEGVVLDRAGTTDFLIPTTAITEVNTASGMIGKFVEKDGLLVITWRLGETLVDTGFRTRSAADRTPTLTTLRTLLGEAS